ncbi:MAG TPA: hypothetical protein PKA00_14300 [Saprospiraceae bacterium]|nr:hypothetical protein [Saprospiraceae bacterium]HMQ84080.1 hypothetical protein [Saprospiraceae bacterium]
MQKAYLLLLGLLCLTSSAFSQRLERFSEDRQTFIKELEAYMTASKRAVLEETYQAFEKVFMSGMFTEEETTQILQTGNAMLGHRMMASPYFEKYLNALMLVKKQSQGELRFKEWHSVLDKILADVKSSRLKPYEDYLEFSILFFQQEAIRYSDSGGTNWYARSGGKYSFDYENEVPSISFPELDLVAARKSDSIVIHRTEGAYYPLDRIWKGKGGRVSWGRHEELGNDVYADLETYEFEVVSSLYEVKEATLHYPLFFGERKIKGSFSDKLVPSTDVTGGSFPRFESFDKVIEIKNLSQGVDYVGGFKLQGKTVYGFGSKDVPAEIKIADQKHGITLRGSAELFTIRKEERVFGEGVEIYMKIDGDTLYHPSVEVRYDFKKNELALTRGEKASDRNPFFSSYHNVHIFAESIIADLNTGIVSIGKSKLPFQNKPEVEFESFHYFEEGDYQRFQNISTVNPIAVLKVLYDKMGVLEIPADTIARKLNPRFNIENIKSLLYDMVSRGFINYDEETTMVEIKEKVFLYADAHRKKTDYDGLLIKSSVDTTNALLNLNDKTMDIRGVSNVVLSDKQRVAIKPLGDQLLLLKNRNIDFDGKLFAGLTLLDGKDLHFKYESYRVDLDSVRFFDLFIPTGAVKKDGSPEATSIGSRIEHLSGSLLIDAPSNKSSREDIPMFPSLQSKATSFVFYDYKSTQGGSYKRDSFYFELIPFSFNHLDYYTADDVQFEGTLYSSDIFPPFPEVVKLQEDLSLGFITKTPEKGYPNYQAKGNYKGQISLSNKGLLGEGTVQYLGAKIDAKDIIFMPKQMLASAEKFNLEENRKAGEEVPKVSGFGVKIDWRPYQDSMYIRSEEAPFALFQEGQHTLDGTLILTPGGLKGNGTFEWDKAILKSKLFAFGAFSSTADTTNVQIKTGDLKNIALETKNVKSDVNFDEQLATFKANDEFLETTLPSVLYRTSMNEFTWDMAEQHITFVSAPDKIGQFKSLHPDKDSLYFEGETAFYDLKTDELEVGGVPYIIAADAYVYPDSGYLKISRGGEMSILENAKIIADTVNRYHVMNRATVEIKGKREYRASGFYEYHIGDRQQEIEFTDILGAPIGKGSMSEKRVITKATGEIKPEHNFYIDHKTEFQGTINLSAETRNLEFDGFARLDVPKLPHRFWFTVNSKADKNDLAISYDEPKNQEGEPLATGFFLAKEAAEAYPRVMSPLFSRRDRPILPVKGIFKYNQQRDQFVFGDSLKVMKNISRGNMLTLNNSDGKVSGEGKFSLCHALKYVKVEGAGTIKSQFFDRPEQVTGTIITDTLALETGNAGSRYEVQAEIMAGVQFPIPEKLMRIMINDIRSMEFSAPLIPYLSDLDYYRMATANLLPDVKETSDAISGLTAGYLDVPKKINPYTVLFSRLPMKWNQEYQSFVSTESQLGVASIIGESINRRLECYVEFKMPTNEDDRLYFYIKSPSELFYFFGYKQGILSVTSNNTAFMDELAAMKAKDLILKMEDGENYEIQAVEVGTARLFLNRVKAAAK